MVADLELDCRTLRRWLRDQGIAHTDRVRAESFRGRLADFDILDDARRTAWATALRAWGVRVLVIDPLGPLLATYGFSEDSNTDVSMVLNAVSTLAAEAGLSEIMIVHHMGHNGERSRGASRLRGWPDAEWRLVREGAAEGQEPPPDAARFFIAEGRDVAVPETRLSYDPSSRHLSVAGGSRIQHAATKWEPDVLAAVQAHPGASGRAIEDALASVPQRAGRQALRALVAAGKVHRFSKGRTVHHVASDECDAPTACLLAKKEAGLDD